MSGLYHPHIDTLDQRLAAARWVDRFGVNRIGLDLDSLGKVARQEELSTWISPHQLSDPDIVGSAASSPARFVICNALNPGSADEIECSLARKVAVLLLPNFTKAFEVESFLTP